MFQRFARSFAPLATSLAVSLVSASLAFSAPVEHVIQISVDGLASWRLQQLVDAAPSEYPGFTRLKNEGASTYNARTDFSHTITIPDHASQLTGRPVLQPAGQPNTVHHGYTSDFPTATDTFHQYNPNITYSASTFDVVHDNGLSTAVYHSKDRMVIVERSYNATNGAPDLIGADNGRDKVDFYLYNSNTPALMTAFLSLLTTNQPDYIFLHLVDPDTAGHASNWASAQYAASIKQTDTNLKLLLDYIDANPEYTNNTALVITADHGGQASGFGGHITPTDPQNYTIPFYAWGPGVPAGDIYNFTSNRFNPGTTRPDYNFAQQPVRNGDAGNLALSLMGFGPIPGSSMNLQFAPVPEPSTLAMLLAALPLGYLAVRRRRSFTSAS